MPLRREGELVPTLDERIAYLEGRTEDHAGAVAELRTDIRDVKEEIRELRAEIQALRQEMTRRFEAMDARIDRLEARSDAKFTWMMGTQVAILGVVIAAFLAR